MWCRLSQTSARLFFSISILSRALISPQSFFLFCRQKKPTMGQSSITSAPMTSKAHSSTEWFIRDPRAVFKAGTEGVKRQEWFNVDSHNDSTTASSSKDSSLTKWIEAGLRKRIARQLVDKSRDEHGGSRPQILAKLRAVGSWGDALNFLSLTVISITGWWEGETR